MIWAGLIVSFAIGILVERARSQYRVVERETARLDSLMHRGGAVDLEPCEFTGDWQERPR